MCGILGYASRSPIDREAFDSALATLSCRGPDAMCIQGYTLGEVEVLLGHTRLAVIDPRPEGNQPMERAGTSVVFNGEIYNFLELKEELSRRGSPFETRTDTEVLLAGYEKWGSDLVDRIEGMFAFALLDSNDHTVFCARDHFGKKPLFYFLDGSRFVFASEMKALLAFPEVRSALELDELSVARVLVFGYVPSPATLFSNIRKLEPASSFTFDIEAWEIRGRRRFWRLEDIEIDRGIGEVEALEAVERLLGEAVKKRLVADVPVGVFLSGGVDSGLVTALVAGESSGINGFTVTYKDYQDDEAEYARRVARELGIEQHCFDFGDADVRPHFLSFMDYLDEPIADAATVPLHFIAGAARDRITVALSGDGGDEVFGGYEKYRAQRLARSMGSLAPLVSHTKRLASPRLYHRRLLEGMGMPSYERQFYWGSGGFSPAEAASITRFNWDASSLFDQPRKYDSDYTAGDTVNRALYLDCRVQLPDWYLVKADRATMANSLEMRSPLLDKALAEYAFSLSGSLKVRGTETKYLLKKLAAKHISPEVVYRRKQGFAVPLRRWISTCLADEFERVLALDFGLFHQAAVKELVERNRAGRQHGSEFMLLRLFVINHYLDKIGWEKDR
jgi:asparagine synthase (glutamine-hydrolysing)